MIVKPECPECGSSDVEEDRKVSYLYRCLECGAYFEADDFELDQKREQRHRDLVKDIFGL